MLSTEGPALAVADINNDGLDDVFIGASKWQKNAVFLQAKGGTFARAAIPTLGADSSYEDVDAQWADFNKDGNMDLVVASGGNEYYGKDTLLSPRIYLGDGKGHLTKLSDAFHDLYINASSVAVDDFDGDGYPDLFIGGRSVPGNTARSPTHTCSATTVKATSPTSQPPSEKTSPASDWLPAPAGATSTKTATKTSSFPSNGAGSSLL
ncbi:FG-GAP repeat domain-containing protein [Puia sp. P3]|uniref:FG-GAP repeat domain-containing protein n=1 Tax=Puia sp. P3 TaxID=3423952 RepID=UPI003D672F60